ncbi:hypothetical protein B0J15DRAFT_260132 [Fusarium solani]|uniref:Uncharacterized protein n=1 Tax=Fusarium solani TaxID=169388 RepID=A0A9P9KMY4_FUSSL|nr:uncharacterized protein B0J15DRAFT_260132 [Fusarium solani]KAH7264026.1 hypothetical protein B0J15DRAFT_260132 [Fusarium solani]
MAGLHGHNVVPTGSFFADHRPSVSLQCLCVTRVTKVQPPCDGFSWATEKLSRTTTLTGPGASSLLSNDPWRSKHHIISSTHLCPAPCLESHLPIAADEGFKPLPWPTSCVIQIPFCDRSSTHRLACSSAQSCVELVDLILVCTPSKNGPCRHRAVSPACLSGFFASLSQITRRVNKPRLVHLAVSTTWAMLIASSSSSTSDDYSTTLTTARWLIPAELSVARSPF